MEMKYYRKILHISYENHDTNGLEPSSGKSIFLYACEPWTLAAEVQRRIRAMEMRCYLRVLRISYKDHVTNEEVCVKILQAIGPHEDLLTIVKKRKLK